MSSNGLASLNTPINHVTQYNQKDTQHTIPLSLEAEAEVATTDPTAQSTHLILTGTLLFHSLMLEGALHLTSKANAGNIKSETIDCNSITSTIVEEVPIGDSKLNEEGLAIPDCTDDDCDGVSLEWDMLRGDSEDQPNESYDSAEEELLENILQNKEQRDELCHMQGRNAQVMIEYLYTLLSKPILPKPWLRRHCIIALYKLCKASKLYPQCYTLKDQIISNDSCETYGGYSDICIGKFGEKKICLKMVRLDKSNMAAMLKRYAKEAILWGQVNHPNIAPFYGIYYRDQMRDQLCLVSPWMDHGHVVQYLQRNPSVSRPLLAYDVVAGLAYLHDSHLIHSDLKGANILVNSLGQACITDFGMSFIRTNKTLAQPLATSTKDGFTQRWASPELLEPDARPSMESDVWALGCVFYEILTGRVPFCDLISDGQVIKALIREEPPGHYGSRKSGSKSRSKPKSSEDEVWKQAEKCWALPPRKRPQCKAILQHLESVGISRPNDPERQHEAQQEVFRMRHAMRMDSDTCIDVAETKRILNHLCTINASTTPSALGPMQPHHPSSSILTRKPWFRFLRFK